MADLVVVEISCNSTALGALTERQLPRSLGKLWYFERLILHFQLASVAKSPCPILVPTVGTLSSKWILLNDRPCKGVGKEGGGERLHSFR